jgi:hypothetical protein
MSLPTHRQLEAFRWTGDRLADETYRELVARGLQRQPVQGIRRLAEEGVPVARQLWNQVTTTPEWVDFARMEPSFRVALQNVIPSGLALMAGSLVESYASARGAKVLVRTGRLQSDTVRRLFETAKFASDIALYRGAKVGNEAWRNVVAVRMMHARVRARLSGAQDWSEEWGLPVNQEDYAGTLFMFSLVYRRSLQRLGVAIDDEFRAANHHVWRHVGWLMGVDEALLTSTVAEERALYDRVKERQFAPDHDSRRLAHGLLEAMAGRPPFFLPAAALYALSRKLVGDELADAFEFPTSKLWARLWRGTRWVNAVVSRGARAPIVAPASTWTGELLTRGIVATGLSGDAHYA